MKHLSIFVDESGDFGDYNGLTEFYVISFVFHDQSEDITGLVEKLDNSLKNVSNKKFAIHTMPLIRREEMYNNMLPNERRSILRKLFFFTKSAPITFKTFLLAKRALKHSTNCMDIFQERWTDSFLSTKKSFLNMKK